MILKLWQFLPPTQTSTSPRIESHGSLDTLQELQPEMDPRDFPYRVVDEALGNGEE